MENGPFEDVFPIKNGKFHCYVSLPEGKSISFETSGLLRYSDTGFFVAWHPGTSPC